MIKDTNKSKKSCQKRLQGQEKKGFIELFILIVIVSVILIFFGLDPKGIWENIIRPIIEWGFDLTVKIIGFLFDIAIWAVNKFIKAIGI